MSARVVLGAVLLPALLQSCAEERPVISRVQPNALEKTYLDGEWYAQQTVAEVPAAVTPGIVGESMFPAMTRVRWDIQENYLYARRSYELIQNSDSDNGDFEAEVPLTEDGHPYMGAIVAAYAITSHFDIVRHYNETTGEEINVIDENTTDRPWYERRFMRVDWSQNLVTDFSFFPDDEVDVTPVPFYVQENDPNEDDRPRFEDDYFDITTQIAVAPGAIDVDWWPVPVPMCWFFYHEDEECATTLLKVRNSYLKVDPERQYEAMEYKGDITEAFGFFWVDRLHNEQHNGVRETDRRRFINRHNLWKEWHDADGNPIPYAEREVRPLVYYLNDDWPEELLPSAERVADEWNQAFKRIVMEQTGWSEADTPDVFVLCEHNPVQEGDPEACGEPGLRVRIGDLRYSMIYWVKDWYDGIQLLGMGPSNADPLTGEIFSGYAYIYLYNDQVATDVEEMVRLLNGDITPFDYINGVDLGRWVESAGGSGAEYEQRTVSEEEKQAMYRSVDVGWARSLPRGDGRRLPPGGMGRQEASEGFSALQRMGAFDPSRDPGDAVLTALRGTPIESMLVNPEIRMAAGFPPDSGLTDEILDRAAVTRGGFMEALRGIDKWRLDLGRRAMDIAEFEDDALYGLAKQIKDMDPPPDSDQIWDIVREKIIDAVLAHEVGHSVGLMHNFGGSEDVFNYDPTYWDLRTNHFTTDPLPRYLDPVTDEQLAGNIYNYAYSSIMDYSGRLTIDQAGVGRYDRAAVMYGYAGLVEVFKDIGAANETDLRTFWTDAGSPLRFEQAGPHAVHYTEWYRRMGDLMWRDDNRQLVPADELTDDSDPAGSLSAWVNPDDDSQRLVRVPYVYCSHNRVNISENCLTRDYGADMYERMMNHIQGLETWYVRRAFPRYEYGFSPETYVAATYARNYQRLKGFNDIYALYNGLLPTFYTDDQIGTFFTNDTTGWGNFTIAIHDAFNELARTITMPDVNDYAADLLPDGTRVLSATGFGGGEEIDVTQGRFFTTSWSDTSFQDDCGYFFWECLHHVGFYLDKIMAIMAMSDANTYFVARDTAEDIREWRISFFDDYATQITSLVGGIVAQDNMQIAPFLDTETLEYYRRDFATPELDPIGAVPPGDAVPVDPYAGFTVQLYAAVLGAARFHNNFDNRFSDALRLWMSGNGHSVDAPTVSYTDPWDGQTYVALDLENGIASRLVARANLLRARSTVCDETPGSPAECIVGVPGAQREAAERELHLIKDNLDVLVDLTGAMDSATGGYADPYDPGGG